MAIRTTPRAIFEKLKKLAPLIAFSVEWIEDPYWVWDYGDPDPRERGYVAHDVDVIARAIIDGEEREGKKNLGGVYEKPGERDSDIHGYLPQMLEEAVVDLVGEDLKVSPREWSPRPINEFLRQARAVVEYLKEVLHVRYEAERRNG